MFWKTNWKLKELKVIIKKIFKINSHNTRDCSKVNGEKDSVDNFGIFGGPTRIDFDADDELAFVDDWQSSKSDSSKCFRDFKATSM